MPLPSVLDEIDRLFDELIHRPWGKSARPLVPTAVREVDDGWIIEFPAEGLRAEDLHIEVLRGQLTITAHHRSEEQQRRGKSGWMRTERETTFHRTMALPRDADPEGIEARLEGTTLSLHVRRRRR